MADKHTVATADNHGPRGEPFGLLSSWVIALESERKSPKTVEAYSFGPTQLAAWLRDNGHADDVRTLTAEQVRLWLRDMAETAAPSTVQTRHKAVRLFLAWCVDEGELDASPMDRVASPAVPEQHLPMLTDDQLRALLADCEGPRLADLRDHALVLMLADTGCRLSEVVNLRWSDVDLRDRSARVMGKGSRPRVVPFGARTARALDRYRRARARTRYGHLDWLWLSTNNKGRLTPNGVHQMLTRRGTRLGFHVHAHQLRHRFADTWLRAGGSEGDLMELAGWRSRQMLTRYASANRSERARQAYRSMSPMDSL